METIFVDGRSCATPLQLHQTLKLMLRLPDYYGCNADALNDCLGERKPIRLFVLHTGEGAVAEELRVCMQVVRDNGGQVVCDETQFPS